MIDPRTLVDGVLVTGILLAGFSGALFAIKSSESPATEDVDRGAGIPLASLKEAA